LLRIICGGRQRFDGPNRYEAITLRPIVTRLEVPRQCFTLPIAP
jgi:hypothetical protein